MEIKLIFQVQLKHNGKNVCTDQKLLYKRDLYLVANSYFFKERIQKELLTVTTKNSYPKGFLSPIFFILFSLGRDT